MVCLGEKDPGSHSLLLWQFSEAQLSVVHGLCLCVWVIFLAQAWPPSHTDHAVHWISKAGGDCFDPFPKRSILSPRPAAQNVDLFKWIILVLLQGTLLILTFCLWAQSNKNLSPPLKMLRADSQEPTLGSLKMWAL